jgi:hypothetical protein
MVSKRTLAAAGVFGAGAAVTIGPAVYLLFFRR